MEVKLVSQTVLDPEYLNKLFQELVQDTKLPEALKASLEKPEGLMAYIARVSSPNQTNPSYAGLLKYCIEHNHWSVFEMIDVTFEITTSRAIAQQILRHRSFCFQEFSQRYAKVNDFELYEARRQDVKNRQNSINDMSLKIKEWFELAQLRVWERAKADYEHALSLGIAKECARFLLPLNTQSKLYMKGSVRSWIHYLNVRTDPSAQKEHRDIAEAIKQIFKEKFPNVSSALSW